MTKTAHTQWKVEEKSQAGYFHVETVRGAIICRVPNYDDAVLIAAAPELLEALEIALECLEEGSPPSEWGEGMIRAAIAKARGEA